MTTEEPRWGQVNRRIPMESGSTGLLWLIKHWLRRGPKVEQITYGIFCLEVRRSEQSLWGLPLGKWNQTWLFFQNGAYKWLPGTLPGDLVGQESTGHVWKDWRASIALLLWNLSLTLVSSSVSDEELDWRWSIPETHSGSNYDSASNRWGPRKEGNKIFWLCLLFCLSPFLHMPQITLIGQLINSHPRLQSPLQLSELHACLVRAAAAVLKPHPSPSSWGLLTSRSLPWPELPLRQLPPETATHMRSSSSSASLKQIQLARGAFQVVKTKEFHSIIGILNLKGTTKRIQFDCLQFIDEDTNAQRGLFI